MALGILFTVLACALVGVAWAAWQGGVLIIALGAIVLSGWLASLAVATFRRGRHPRACIRRGGPNSCPWPRRVT